MSPAPILLALAPPVNSSAGAVAPGTGESVTADPESPFPAFAGAVAAGAPLPGQTMVSTEMVLTAAGV